MSPARLFLAASALTAATASAQVGGFVDGDMFLATRNVEASGSQDGGVLWVDPLTGTTDQIVDFSFASYARGTMAFDSYRKRLVVSTSIDIGGPVYGIWSSDAFGNLERLAPTTEGTHGLAPTGDGRIYVITPFDGSAPFKWYDAANRKHTLLDDTGNTPFGFSGIYSINDSCMTYDAATNALFVAYRGNSGPGCSGGSANGTTIKKLPLSADGTRVIGPVQCIEHQADVIQSQEVPSNWSRGPGGTLVLVCDTPGHSDDIKPRVAVIDPFAFTVSTWAEPGDFLGADQLTAGAYSSRRNDVLMLDTFHNVLRGYGAGASGEGIVVSPNGPLSPAVGAGEYATLVEIDTGACGGGIQALGEGLAGFGGEVPTLIANGCADVGDTLTLEIRDVVGGAWGMVLASLTPGEIPHRGGTLSMGSVDITVPIVLGGASGTPGAGAIDLPVALTDPLLTGLSLYVQAGFSDTGAVAGTSLTQGLRLEID